MKRRTREYNYDWMLNSVVNAGLNMFNGTPEEIEGFIKLVPSLKDLVNTFLRSGEMGRLFLGILVDYFGKIINAHKKGDKIALGTFMCSHLLFDAFDGLQAMWAEPITGLGGFIFRHGNYEYYDYACEKGFTETSCSAQRGVLGAILADLMTAAKPDICVLGAAGPCDSNCNSMQFYAEYARIPLVTVDTPATLVDDRVNAYEVRDVENMIEQVEKLTGARLNENKLRELLEEKKKQNAMLNEIMELMRLVPSPVPIMGITYIYSANIFAKGSKLTTALIEEVLRVSLKNAKEGRAGTYSGIEKTRLFMCYIDHFNMDAAFFDWLGANDISVMVNQIWTLWWEGAIYGPGLEDECYKIDTTSRESMIRSVAGLNAHLAMNKQLRGPYDAKGQWLSDCKAMCKTFKPDYLVYAGTLGCRNSWGVNKIMQREMEKLGYPFLISFADCFDERPNSWESVKHEMEEFMRIRRSAQCPAQS